MKTNRWVIKIGSGLLTADDGRIDHARFADLAAQVRALMGRGHEIVLVSSGAIASAMALMGLEPNARRPPPTLRACATIGQIELMAEYRRNFAGHGLFPAQLLLTYGDFDSRSCHRNAAATIDRLLGLGKYVPVINENDAIADDEIKFGDNDRLSAHVATLCRADKLIILSGIDGLLTKLDGSVRSHPRGDESRRGALPRRRHHRAHQCRRHDHEAPRRRDRRRDRLRDADHQRPHARHPRRHRLRKLSRHTLPVEEIRRGGLRREV